MVFLFLFVLAFPVAEFIVTGWLIARYGWDVIGIWSLITVLIGMLMLRHHQIAMVSTILGDMRQGRVSVMTMFKLICYYIAAILFILPGVLGDVIAVVLLLWPARTPGKINRQPADDGVIEGEYREVNPAPDENKRIH
jgi:UPF0716 protein FxsA